MIWLISFSRHSNILSTCYSFWYWYCFINLLSRYTYTSTSCTWILNRYTWSSTSITCHLNCHRSLSIINRSSSSTISATSRSSSWLAFATITCGTYSFFLKLNLFLYSVYRVHEIDFHIQINVLSFHGSFSSHSHIKKWRKISKSIFESSLFLKN